MTFSLTKLLLANIGTSSCERPSLREKKLEYNCWADPNIVAAPTHDPHCSNNHISHGCEPVEVISTNTLVDYTQGPAETTRRANG